MADKEMTEVSEAQIASHWKEEELYPPNPRVHRPGKHDGRGHL